MIRVIRVIRTIHTLRTVTDRRVSLQTVLALMSRWTLLTTPPSPSSDKYSAAYYCSTPVYTLILEESYILLIISTPPYHRNFLNRLIPQILYISYRRSQHKLLFLISIFVLWNLLSTPFIQICSSVLNSMVCASASSYLNEETLSSLW